MGNPLKDLSAGLARFVYAWLVPSATVVAVFAAFVLPEGSGVAQKVEAGGLGSIAFFGIAVLILSVVFAYGAQPIYRVLEGYRMPSALKRRLRKRRLREWYRLTAIAECGPELGVEWQLTRERLEAYPRSPETILPTRLGNALAAMESYGDELFGLDSQTLWYELQSIAPDNLRHDIEDAQAGVDIFISALVHLVLLGVVAGVIGAVSRSLTASLVAITALALAPIAYDQAVRNVSEYRDAVRALVNTSRLTLAEALGLRLPATFKEERELWENYIVLIQHGRDDEYFEFLDDYRAAVSPSLTAGDQSD